jgi:hypothetical protein
MKSYQVTKHQVCGVILLSLPKVHRAEPSCPILLGHGFGSNIQSIDCTMHRPIVSPFVESQVVAHSDTNDKSLIISSGLVSWYVDAAAHLTMLGFYIAGIAAGLIIIGLDVFMLIFPYKVYMRNTSVRGHNWTYGNDAHPPSPPRSVFMSSFG